MVDAVSLSAGSHSRTSALAFRSIASPVEAERPAATALAALAVPVTQVSASSEAADDLGFLYSASGRPASTALPSRAVPATPAAFEAQPFSARAPSARLSVESGELNALLSSLMAAPAARTENEGGVQTVIARLYSQF